MKIGVKDTMVYLGFFLFGLSVIAATLNEKAAIIMLIASFGVLIFGGIVKS
jgi:hypothetical protein